MNARSTTRRHVRSLGELVSESNDSLGATLLRLAELAAAAHLYGAGRQQGLNHERSRSQGRLLQVDGSELPEPRAHKEVRP